MCKDCGCGTPHGPGAHPPGEPHSHTHEHTHEHGPGFHHGEEHPARHSHPHPHTHTHSHAHSGAPDHNHVHAAGDAPDPPPAESAARRTVEVQRSLLDQNDRAAERNRGFFRASRLLTLNVLSSPGSGKTTLLGETIRALGEGLKAAVIVGDLATDYDARRLRETGAPVVQIATGTMCHLEAEMIGRACRELDLQGRGLLIIENVGNLVCPASYDLGEDLRVVLLSVTEGEDKPLKYPPAFQSAHVVVVSKLDLTEACGVDRALLRANVRKVAPAAEVFEVSARTGLGMADWCAFLKREQAKAAARHPLD